MFEREVVVTQNEVDLSQFLAALAVLIWPFAFFILYYSQTVGVYLFGLFVAAHYGVHFGLFLENLYHFEAILAFEIADYIHASLDVLQRLVELLFNLQHSSDEQKQGNEFHTISACIFLNIFQTFVQIQQRLIMIPRINEHNSYFFEQFSLQFQIIDLRVI